MYQYIGVRERKSSVVAIIIEPIRADMKEP